MTILKSYVSANVAKASTAILQHRESWLMVDTLMGGTLSMRQAGKSYLPQEPKETDDEYLRRLKRSTLDNYYKEAINKAVGKVFSKDVSLEELPTELQMLAEDVDSQQRNLTQFSKDVFADAMNHGVSYIMVDYAKVPMDAPFANRAQELASGTRPYWVKVSSSSVLDARPASFNGSERLSVFKFQETISELNEDGIGEKMVQQIREYRQLPDASGNPGPVEYFVYRLDPENKERYEIHDQGIVTASAIPVAPVYANRTGFYLGKPPMMELAELNMQHWAQSSDLNNIMHVVTVPFLFAKGLTEMDAKGRAKAMTVSIHQAINTANKDADVKWIEHGGSAVNSAKEHLSDLTARMEYLACQLSTQASSNVTATQAAISAAEANSNLKSMALQLQDGINAALFFTAEFLGLTNYGRAAVNTAFSVDYVDAATFAEVKALFDMGLIDRDVLIAEAKRRNIVDSTVKAKPEEKPEPVITQIESVEEVDPEDDESEMITKDTK